MSERTGWLSTFAMRRSPGPYRDPRRLADVMALIQALALHPDQTHRHGKSLFVELGGAPRSSKSWYSLALDHPEFFRVSWPVKVWVPDPNEPPPAEDSDEPDSPVEDDNRWPISLLVRHLIPRRTEVGRDGKMRIPPLKIEEIQPLLELAIAMHDQQEKAATKYVALAGAVGAAMIGAGAAVIVAAIASFKVASDPPPSNGAAQQLAPLAPASAQAAPKAKGK